MNAKTMVWKVVREKDIHNLKVLLHRQPINYEWKEIAL